nr:aldo/keto reductase [uncultured Helicobacter sp.]
MQDSRREFLKTSGKLTAMVAVLGSNMGVLMADSNPHKTTLNLKGQSLARSLGKVNPLQVSALAFGCMGLNYHRSKRLSEKEASNIVAEALSYGINFFDTAQVYGPDSNEILTGKILKPYRDKVIIATKFGFGANNDKLDSSPKRIRQVVEQSLKRLHLESLPLLYQHRFNPKNAHRRSRRYNKKPYTRGQSNAMGRV